MSVHADNIGCMVFDDPEPEEQIGSPCPDCDGAGELLVGAQRFKCIPCDGTGVQA